MSVLVVGLSHRTAPIALVERAFLDENGVAKLQRAAIESDHVGEAFVVATCNRLELFADVTRFHVGAETLTALLVEHTGIDEAELAPHLELRYEDRAVAHLFALTCGLESMVVGETQILGQVRSSLRTAQADATVGRVLGGLVQQALRVGKRAHHETGIDTAARSIVSAGLDVAGPQLGGLEGRSAVIVGAGAMGRLAGALLGRAGSRITVVNRTPAHAEALAAAVGGVAAPADRVEQVLAAADLVVSCTGASGTVLDLGTLTTARAGVTTPLVVLDLALPHDVDPRVAELPHVTLVGLTQLAELSVLHDGEPDREVDAVRAIVDDEVVRYLSVQRAERVSPTVVALRERADELASVEVSRLHARMPDLDPAVRDEIADTVRRTLDKLLHEPTVRMKALATEKGGDQYADALRRLFDLDVPTELEDDAASTERAFADADADAGADATAPADGGAR
jgi:glutamyl-tRNA reductase